MGLMGLLFAANDKMPIRTVQNDAQTADLERKIQDLDNTEGNLQTFQKSQQEVLRTKMRHSLNPINLITPVNASQLATGFGSDYLWQQELEAVAARVMKTSPDDPFYPLVREQYDFIQWKVDRLKLLGNRDLADRPFTRLRLLLQGDRELGAWEKYTDNLRGLVRQSEDIIEKIKNLQREAVKTRANSTNGSTKLSTIEEQTLSQTIKDWSIEEEQENKKKDILNERIHWFDQQIPQLEKMSSIQTDDLKQTYRRICMLTLAPLLGLLLMSWLHQKHHSILRRRIIVTGMLGLGLSSTFIVFSELQINISYIGFILVLFALLFPEALRSLFTFISGHNFSYYREKDLYIYQGQTAQIIYRGTMHTQLSINGEIVYLYHQDLSKLLQRQRNDEQNAKPHAESKNKAA